MNKLTSRLYKCLPLPLKRQYDRIAASDIGKRMSKSVFWSLTGSVLSQGLMLLATIVVARILGKTEYGELGMIRSTVSMFAVFAGFGLGMTATKYIAEFRYSHPEKTGKIIGLTTLFAGGTGGIISIIILLSAPYIATHSINAPHLVNEIRLGAVMLFFSALNGAQTGTLSGFEAFKTIARVNLVSGLLAFPIQIGCTLLLGLQGSVIGFGLSFCILWILNFFAVRQESKKAGIAIRFSKAWDEWNVLLKFSLPALLSGILVSPVMWACNALLVNKPGGYDEMALFDAANQWRNAILFIPAILAQIALPMLSAHVHDKPKFNRILKLNIRINVIVATAIAVLVSLLAVLIMKSYGKGFAEGSEVLIVLAGSAVLVAVNNIIGQAIASKGRMWAGFSLNLIWSVILISCTAWFINRGMGAKGIALGLLISYVLHTITQSVFVHFIMRKQVPTLPPTTNAIKESDHTSA